jgi:type 1 fimbriae regulatory protein FimB
MGEIKYLSRELQGCFLKAVKGSKHFWYTRDLLYFTLALRYGLRASEARNIKLSQVRIDENSIFITRVKGGVSQYYPLREDDLKLIEKWLKQRKKMTHGDSPYLFITNRSDKMSRLLPIKLFEKYAEIAGIEGHTCHSLRHSCAVNLLDQNVDLFDIKTWLGHSSINSTMKYLRIGSKKTRQRMKHVLDSI